ncbi:hypothetical protein KGF54_003307 [Candida jiufengensis]|uniref:uncharacterized protein n=1 Tax=Candida jiufengensis TaxID=497108 RepID=UPI0022245614|nr:uncharacterized protein KGF54_003307 [Candida jiufengensis]KAI5952440.1 hypothetical protein KGF54_003307 [Candida jiufengensis]
MNLLQIIVFLITSFFTEVCCFQDSILSNDFQFKDYEEIHNFINENSNTNNILHYQNLNDLQENLEDLYTYRNLTNSVVLFHLIDDDHYLIPEINQYPTTNSDSDSGTDSNSDSDFENSVAKKPQVPQNWIEFYATNIQQLIDPRGIEIQTLSTVDSVYARGEVAYSLGQLRRVATEYDMNASLFLGLNIFIGGLVGFRFAPEIDFSNSFSTFYTCPVTFGKTVVIKVYPYLTYLNPHYKNLKWNRKIKQFATAFNFNKLNKIKLFTMTGLEDVECVYH